MLRSRCVPLSVSLSFSFFLYSTHTYTQTHKTIPTRDTEMINMWLCRGIYHNAIKLMHARTLLIGRARGENAAKTINRRATRMESTNEKLIKHH